MIPGGAPGHARGTSRKAARSKRAPAHNRVFVVLFGTIGLLAIVVAWLGTRQDSRSGAESDLIARLRSSDGMARATAANALGRRSNVSVAAVRELAALLEDPNVEPRSEAAAALISIGRGNVPAGDSVIGTVTSRLANATSPARVLAAQILGQLGVRSAMATRHLVSAMRTPDDSLRAAAAAALGQIGVADSTVLPAVNIALGDRMPEVRAAAVGTLARLQPDAAADSAARLALEDESPLVRLEAVYALRTTGRYQASVERAFRGALRDPVPEVRRAAALAFAQHGHRARSAHAALVEALTDSVESVRQAAARALQLVAGERLQ